MNMSHLISPPWMLLYFTGLGLLLFAFHAGNALKFSCGSETDFGYSGGVPYQGSPISISPFPISSGRLFTTKGNGANSCYNFFVQSGIYSVRVFFGWPEGVLVPPLFHTSIKGTLVHTMSSGWESRDEETFIEIIHKIDDNEASVCFHKHTEPRFILSIELYKLTDYHISCLKCDYMRTHTRLNFGTNKSSFEDDDLYGNRFWRGVSDFGGDAKGIHTNKSILVTSTQYPAYIYKTALVGTPRSPDLGFFIERVVAKKKYKVILHFCKINDKTLGDGIFDILFDSVKVDVVDLVGRPYTSLMVNYNVEAMRDHLTVFLKAREGSISFINAIEVHEVITAADNTFSSQVSALMELKSFLQISSNMGWNGDPCSPNTFIWSGVKCALDKKQQHFYIEALNLSHQSLKGSLPDDLSSLSRLKYLNLSFNEIGGSISALGSIKTLEILDLSDNNFSGSIPGSFPRLPRLRVLNLSRNNLSGVVPSFSSSISLSLSENDGLCGHAGFPPCHYGYNSLHLVATAVVVVLATMILLFFVLRRIAKAEKGENRGRKKNKKKKKRREN